VYSYPLFLFHGYVYFGIYSRNKSRVKVNYRFFKAVKGLAEASVIVPLFLQCKIYKQTKPVPVAESQLCSSSPTKNIKKCICKSFTPHF
jgi:hypothetical protein